MTVTLALIFAMLTPYLASVHLPLLGNLARASRPSVMQNGTDVVGLPFSADKPNSTVVAVAFGPDGTAYFCDAQGELASLSPAGAYTKIPAPRVRSSYSMLYARGSLWTAADSGIVRVSTDGKSTRWYQLNVGQAQFNLSGYDGIINGPNGTILIAGQIYDIHTGLLSAELVSIDTHGVPTVTTLGPGEASGPLVYDSLGHLYFGYTTPNGAFSINRLEADGSMTSLPFPYPQYVLAQVNSMVNVHGTVYLTGDVYVYSVQQGEHSVGFFGQIPPNGAISQIALPGAVDTTSAAQMSADFGGNLWLGLGVNEGKTLLYGYNTYNKTFSAAVEPALLNQIYVGPFTGPDNNIWNVRYDTNPLMYYEPTGFEVYVKAVQTLEPAALNIARGQTANFTILETHFNGPWTAQSASPSIVSVSPASSPTGAFTVTGVAHGSARIMVKDQRGNFSYESVTSN